MFYFWLTYFVRFSIKLRIYIYLYHFNGNPYRQRNSTKRTKLSINFPLSITIFTLKYSKDKQKTRIMISNKFNRRYKLTEETSFRPQLILRPTTRYIQIISKQKRFPILSYALWIYFYNYVSTMCFRPPLSTEQHVFRSS